MVEERLIRDVRQPIEELQALIRYAQHLQRLTTQEAAYYRLRVRQIVRHLDAVRRGYPRGLQARAS